jgi:hypothetical protein
VIRRVVRMYEQVETGPLYDKAVQLMTTYRSRASRMENAKAGTQGKLDRQLERLSEKITERLGELTDMERSALTCWQDGVVPGAYELDHAEITDRPYISIRKIDRWDEEYDVDEMKALLQAGDERDNNQKETGSTELRAFLSLKADY